jgi:chemotaxis protein MotB
MQASGIRGDQITQVRGFADQHLRKPEAPLDPANRRISLIVQYLLKNSEESEGGGKTNEKSPAVTHASPAPET